MIMVLWHICKMMISLMIDGAVFSFFLKLSFFRLLGGKRTKNSSKGKVTITCVTHHTSETGKHVIMNFHTLVLNDDIPRLFLHFFQVFTFWAVSEVKGKIIAQNENNNYIRHEPYLRNCIAYGHDFCYSCINWWYFWRLLSCFWYFHSQGC